MDQNYLWSALTTPLVKNDWAGVPNLAVGKSGEMTSEFQKLLEQKDQPVKSETQAKDQSKAEDSSGVKKEKAPVQEEEDPVETVKKMQVYLVPEDPNVLAQYPPEWLPQVEEGEAIVCVGVTTDENGQEMPILMGANEAYERYGFQTVVPETAAQPQVEADVPEELAQAPAAQAEQTTVKNDAPQVRPVSEEVQPQQEEESSEIEITDAEQAPHAIFRDVEAAPIKVGEAPAAAQSEQTQDVSEQIAEPLSQALAQGETRVEIKLTPDSLGSVTIEVTHSQDGGLRVALSAESDQTRGLLEKHAVNLQGLLASRGQENVQVEVQRNQEGQQQHNDQYDGRNGGHNGQPQQERRHQQEQHGQDFLHQLRLGLVPADEELF